MKIQVKRTLSDGLYNVQFEVSEFTEDEKRKFAAFGVPLVTILAPSGAIQTVQVSPGRVITQRVLQPRNVPLTEVSNYPARFKSEEEARQFESSLLTEVKDKMTALRERKDDFSSSEEISL